MTNESERFATAYVAASYLLERRGDALLDGLPSSSRAKNLATELSRDDRAARAQVLAGELSRIARSLEERLLK